MLPTVKLYLLGGVALVIVGLMLFAGWQYDQAGRAQARADAMQTKLDQQSAWLAQLQRGQEADSAAIASMAASQAQVTQHGGVVRQRVATMEAANAAVHDVLSLRLPAGGCLLDDTCPASTGAGSAEPGSAAAVRGAVPGAE